MAIVADFSSGNTSAYTVAAHQFDKGQKLIVTGVELPETYEVHISNTKTGGFASAYVGNSNGVLIPDVYFTSGEYIYVWIYATAKEQISPKIRDISSDEEESSEMGDITIDSGRTIYEITIPIIKRPAQLPIRIISQEPSTIGYIVDENNTLIPVKQ